MKEYWEDSHIMYDDEEDNKKIYWTDFLGGVIVCIMIFFCCYGMYAFFKDIFF